MSFSDTRSTRRLTDPCCSSWRQGQGRSRSIHSGRSGSTPSLLFRYREISAQSNVRYLEALSQVQDPTPAVRDLDALTTNASTTEGRTARAFNPLSRNERMLFEVLLAGEHALHGFTNRDVRQKLARTSYPLAPNEDMQPSQVTRLFRRTDSSPKFRARAAGGSPWPVAGPCPTAIKLRDVAYPALFAATA